MKQTPISIVISTINHIIDDIPSGYLLHSHGKIHHAINRQITINHLFLWAMATMVMLNNQMVLLLLLSVLLLLLLLFLLLLLLYI